MNDDSSRIPPFSFKQKIVQWLSEKPLIKGMISFIVLSVATNLFSGLFNLWSIAIKNASKGIFRKFCDTYIIRAATTELEDNASGFIMVVSFAFLFFLWLFDKFLAVVYNQREADFRRITSKDSSRKLNNQKDNPHQATGGHLQ